jgi:hypothetical protein
MSSPLQRRHRYWLLTFAILTVGCGKQEQIHSYTVDRASPRPPAGETGPVAGNGAATTGAATDRMLAAILPDGRRAWFFKVVGPAPAIENASISIAEFFASIRPAGDQPLPVWKLPAGWSQQPGNEFRAATLVIPGDKPLELTVSTLGWSGSQDDLLRNINRWRGQMQLPEIGPQQLGDTTREIKVGDATMTVVDLAGRFQSGGMTPPFAGQAPFAGGPPFAGGGQPPAAGGNASTGSPPATAPELPDGHPPVGPTTDANPAPPPAEAASKGGPQYALPKTWQVLPIEPGSMRKAAFNVAEGPKQALITVTQFSALVPAMADPLQNVNRWRGEIGFPRIENDSLATVTESTEVGGQKATYMAAIPDTAKPEESQMEQATLAAMVRVGDQMWFFKLKGNRELVAAEQENFKDFLKSVRFTADRGATDGN